MKYIALIAFMFVISACEQSTNTNKAELIVPDSAAKVYFLEFGANSCDDCLAMRPIMDSVSNIYGPKIKVVFIDVIKNQKEAAKYNIRMMPTQVFLDSAANEFFRNEGFLELNKIIDLLSLHGVKK